MFLLSSKSVKYFNETPGQKTAIGCMQWSVYIHVPAFFKIRQVFLSFGPLGG
jgi:hypothetical protein